MVSPSFFVRSFPKIGLNAAANLVGSSYIALANLIVLPLFLDVLGGLEFGIVAFSMVVYALSQMLDMGMSPLLAREAARLRECKSADASFVRLLRTFECISVILAIAVIATIHLSGNYLLVSWLNLSVDSADDYSICMSMLGLSAGLRLTSSIYKFVLKGLERQLLLNVVLMLISTIRFPGALLALYFGDGGVTVYFLIQVLASALELLSLRWFAYQTVPDGAPVPVRIYWGELKSRSRFLGGVAYAAVVWVLLSNIDKLILSKFLPIDDFGFFVIASSLSAGVFLISAPITDATLPRLTFLYSAREHGTMHLLYRRTTMYIASIAFSYAAVMAVYSEKIAGLWTRNPDAEILVAEVLPFLTYGSAIAVVAGMLYQLQLVSGKLRLHSLYNTLLVLIQVPLLYFAVVYYGALGAAATWAGIRVFTILLWTPIVHKVHAPGIHGAWFLESVLMPLLVSVAVAYGSAALSSKLVEYIGAIGVVAFAAICTLMITVLFGTYFLNARNNAVEW